MKEYQEWIDENVKTPEEAYGTCAEITVLMQAVFQELKRVRGHYWDPVWGRREHWWLITATGVIVDPTAKQFPSKGKGYYDRWVEGDEEPTGKCPNCGDYTYRGRTCCSDNCEQEFIASLG